ncbi:hypothetical protein [Luteibacter yeojuensis]|uniref:Uncharacterized protein n=1 Tax=Luteibacter yeojuensis TaxID=345309 RepID=A0A7X5QU85_9GAMM|nr:hypothetical protein [Luteibacter yeojuensis]NID15405.1 hypothetical protein [Luteibacter yeojuensis]
MKRIDLESAKKMATEAAKTSSSWAYQHNYASGMRTISVREPTSHTLNLTSLHSWDFAKIAGCSGAVALSRLRKLAAAGFLTEERRYSTACCFRLSDDAATQIGREIIAELQAEGVPFEDDWRAGAASQKVPA